MNDLDTTTGSGRLKGTGMVSRKGPTTQSLHVLDTLITCSTDVGTHIKKRLRDKSISWRSLFF